MDGVLSTTHAMRQCMRGLNSDICDHTRTFGMMTVNPLFVEYDVTPVVEANRLEQYEEEVRINEQRLDGTRTAHSSMYRVPTVQA